MYNELKFDPKIDENHTIWGSLKKSEDHIIVILSKILWTSIIV